MLCLYVFSPKSPEAGTRRNQLPLLESDLIDHSDLHVLDFGKSPWGVTNDTTKYFVIFKLLILFIYYCLFYYFKCQSILKPNH